MQRKKSFSATGDKLLRFVTHHLVVVCAGELLDVAVHVGQEQARVGLLVEELDEALGVAAAVIVLGRGGARGEVLDGREAGDSILAADAAVGVRVALGHDHLGLVDAARGEHRLADAGVLGDEVLTVTAPRRIKLN